MRRCIFWMNLADGLWDETVAAHRKEGTGLGIHHDQQHGCQAGNGPRAHDSRAEAIAQLTQDKRNRLGIIQLRIRYVAGHDRRHGDVEQGADQQRADDAGRHVMRRILRLLGRRRNGVHAEIGEEDDRCAG